MDENSNLSTFATLLFLFFVSHCSRRRTTSGMGIVAQKIPAQWVEECCCSHVPHVVCETSPLFDRPQRSESWSLPGAGRSWFWKLLFICSSLLNRDGDVRTFCRTGCCNFVAVRCCFWAWSATACGCYVMVPCWCTVVPASRSFVQVGDG